MIGFNVAPLIFFIFVFLPISAFLAFISYSLVVVIKREIKIRKDEKKAPK